MIPVKIFVNGVQAATGNIDLSVVGSTQTVASAGGDVTATLTANMDIAMTSGYLRVYSFQATAAAQYQFARWRRVQRIYIQGDDVYDPEVVRTFESVGANPYVSIYDEDGYGASYNQRIWDKSEIEAYFTSNPHTPTHLLVNSSSRSTPVRLVYDPSTNKLVADY